MRALRWLLIVVIAVGVVLGVSPLGLRWWVEREFAKVGIEANFQRFELDYLLGEMRLGGVSLAGGRGGMLGAAALILAAGAAASQAPT